MEVDFLNTNTLQQRLDNIRGKPGLFDNVNYGAESVGGGMKRLRESPSELPFLYDNRGGSRRKN